MDQFFVSEDQPEYDNELFYLQEHASTCYNICILLLFNVHIYVILESFVVVDSDILDCYDKHHWRYN